MKSFFLLLAVSLMFGQNLLADDEDGTKRPDEDQALYSLDDKPVGGSAATYSESETEKGTSKFNFSVGRAPADGDSLVDE